MTMLNKAFLVLLLTGFLVSSSLIGHAQVAFDCSATVTFEEGAPSSTYTANATKTALAASTADSIYSAVNISSRTRTANFSYTTTATLLTQDAQTILSQEVSSHSSGDIILTPGQKWGGVHDEASTGIYLGIGTWTAGGDAYVEEDKTGDFAETLIAEKFQVVSS